MDVLQDDAAGDESERIPLFDNPETGLHVEAMMVASVRLYRYNVDERGEKQRVELLVMKHPDEFMRIDWDGVKARYGGGEYEAIAFGNAATFGNNGVVKKEKRSFEGPPKQSFAQQLKGTFDPNQPVFETESGVVAATGLDPEKQSLSSFMQQIFLLQHKTNQLHEERMEKITIQSMSTLATVLSAQKDDSVGDMMKLLMATLGGMMGGAQKQAGQALEEQMKLMNKLQEVQIEKVKLESKPGIAEGLVKEIPAALPAIMNAFGPMVEHLRGGGRTDPQLNNGQPPPSQIEPPNVPTNGQG